MFTYLKSRNELARHERALRLIRNSNAEEMKSIHEYAEQERIKILRRLRRTPSRPNLLVKFVIGLGANYSRILNVYDLGRLMDCI